MPTQKYDPSTFTKHDSSHYVMGCRCDVCHAAWRHYNAEMRRFRREYVAEYGLPEGVQHGRNAYKNWGCHCEVCRGADRDRRRARRDGGLAA